MLQLKGILNQNGKETIMIMYLKPDSFDNDAIYNSFVTIGKSDYIMNTTLDYIHFNNTYYKYVTVIHEKEIIIIATEFKSLLHKLFPCIFKQSFFVLTNYYTKNI